jgi:hypothetical protein
MAARRSPRDGWRLVELVDGRWRVTARGDREQIRGAYVTRVGTLMSMPLDHTKRFTQRYQGAAAVLFDAIGQRREQFPSLPHLADGTRVEWPAAVPGVDGEDAVVWSPKAVA